MHSVKEYLINLTETAEIVEWPETHYVYVEKIGPFQTNAPQAWQDLHSCVSRIAEHNQVAGYMSLYKLGPQIRDGEWHYVALLPRPGGLSRLSRTKCILFPP
jgi:hypothetical protein